MRIIWEVAAINAQAVAQRARSSNRILAESPLMMFTSQKIAGSTG
jgi:hypothetical protein